MASNYIDLPTSGSSAGVASLNTLTGALTLLAGSGITITPGVGSLTIASTGGSSGITALTGDVTASGSGSVVASLTAITNATITTLSALSLPAAQLTGTVSVAHGGTGQTTTTAAFRLNYEAQVWARTAYGI